MMTRSPSPRVIGGLLVAVLMSGAGSVSYAQQQSPLRPGQTPGPRFIMATMRGDGSKLGFQVAHAVRERIASDFEMRALWVVPESTITDYLVKAGYPADQALSKQETVQLAQSFSAAELLDGVVSKTSTGGYRVQAAWSLSGRPDMVQPLPPVEAAKIGDVAKLVAREFQAARKQVESVQRCNSLARDRNYTGAIAEARKAIDAYPQSVLGRICIANVYAAQKLAPDSMLRIADEILAIHPENARALAFAADAYMKKGLVADQIRALVRLIAVDPTNVSARTELARAYANSAKPDSARPMIDSAAVLEPLNVDVASLQWLIDLAMKDWNAALENGARMVSLDTSRADASYFKRMAGAADGAQRPDMAANFISAGVKKFPADDELALLEVQYLRRGGKLREARAAAATIAARNPRLPNVWPQKARIEAELLLPADTVLATLKSAIDNGDDRGTVARFAMSFGGTTARDTLPNKFDPLRQALRYYKFAESTQPSDTTSYRVGTTSVLLAQRLATDPSAPKTCDVAKEMQNLVVDAQIALPKAGKSIPEVARYLIAAGQVGPYADQLAKAVCKKD